MENEGESTNQEQVPAVEGQPLNTPVPENNVNPQATSSPGANFNSDSIYPSPVNNDQNAGQDYSGSMVGVGGSSLDIKPDRSEQNKKIISTLVTIAVLLVLSLGGVFLYRYFYFPPSNWKQINDSAAKVSFYFPPCGTSQDNEIPTNGEGYAKNYMCGVNSPKAAYGVSVLVVNNTSNIFSTEDGLKSYLSNSGMELVSKNNVTKKGNPAIDYEATLKSGTNTGKVTGLFVQKKDTNTFINLAVIRDINTDIDSRLQGIFANSFSFSQ